MKRLFKKECKFFPIAYLTKVLNEEFLRIGTVLTSNVWTKHVYKTKDMNAYAGPYDCANECKNIEKDNSCQFIALVVGNMDFIKPWSPFTCS